ncbi:hypothetical protein Pla123a_05520 [Posidoniimonas polymericola]|uniref:Uncharacterized protein n=1 Tax=Posidoniimonas polymericola TaxID=2528002 RepID=A0A5C5ZF65_9BACT|nr:hypothetical protein [Posidoniimonas polymericola]TWT85745.1 hypothetical protein Pla123a_05520 [Posidoniimonas polymericola]
MTPSPTETIGATKPCGWQEPWGSFANWSAGRLHLAMEFDGQAFTLRPLAEGSEPAEKPARSGLGSSLLHRRKRDADVPASGERFDSAAELAGQLIARLADLETPPNLAPEGQPERVHDLAGALLGAYQVANGRSHIAGCHFEDVPFVRVTSVAGGDDPAFVHTLYDSHGDAVPQALADQLGLTHTKDLEFHLPAPPHCLAPRGTGAPLPTGVVWAKRVSGHIQFTIGESTLKAPFEGWASTLEAPLVTCPHTGRQTRSLALVEGLGIVAAEEIGRCEVSDRELLDRDLVTCAATGKRVDPGLTKPCPVSGELSLASEFVACKRCGQQVSHASQQGGRCEGCRRMRRVRAGEPSLEAIKAAHPTLAALRRWRLAETDSVYLLQGSQALTRYLLVVNRDDLSIVRACRVGPLGGVSELSPAERLALLAS